MDTFTSKRNYHSCVHFFATGSIFLAFYPQKERIQPTITLLQARQSLPFIFSQTTVLFDECNQNYKDNNFKDNVSKKRQEHGDENGWCTSPWAVAYFVMWFQVLSPVVKLPTFLPTSQDMMYSHVSFFPFL